MKWRSHDWGAQTPPVSRHRCDNQVIQDTHKAPVSAVLQFYLWLCWFVYPSLSVLIKWLISLIFQFNPTSVVQLQSILSSYGETLTYPVSISVTVITMICLLCFYRCETPRQMTVWNGTLHLCLYPLSRVQ